MRERKLDNILMIVHSPVMKVVASKALIVVMEIMWAQALDGTLYNVN